jgi:hypothetical protein
MTADCYPFEHGRFANRIINEVRGINRVIRYYLEAVRHDRMGVTE